MGENHRVSGYVKCTKCYKTKSGFTPLSFRESALICFEFLILIVVIASASGSASIARRKGHRGYVFGFLHSAFVFSSAVTGMMMGLFIGLKLDPFLDKSTAIAPLLWGSGGGLAFGTLFMFLVVRLLPDRSEE